MSQPETSRIYRWLARMVFVSPSCENITPEEEDILEELEEGVASPFSNCEVVVSRCTKGIQRCNSLTPTHSYFYSLLLTAGSLLLFRKLLLVLTPARSHFEALLLTAATTHSLLPSLILVATLLQAVVAQPYRQLWQQWATLDPNTRQKECLR